LLRLLSLRVRVALGEGNPPVAEPHSYNRSEGEIRGQVRPHETVNIYHGQPICMMEFFRNAAVPARPYGFAGSNYQGQTGPKLAKYFLAPPA
jgi:hypothetical protein